MENPIIKKVDMRHHTNTDDFYICWMKDGQLENTLFGHDEEDEFIVEACHYYYKRKPFMVSTACGQYTSFHGFDENMQPVQTDNMPEKVIDTIVEHLSGLFWDFQPAHMETTLMKNDLVYRLTVEYRNSMCGEPDAIEYYFISLDGESTFLA